MSKQLSMNLGALSGTESVRPFAQGDEIVRHDGVRCVVTQADRDAADRDVLVCVRLDTGASCVVLGREVAYRSVRV